MKQKRLGTLIMLKHEENGLFLLPALYFVNSNSPEVNLVFHFFQVKEIKQQSSTRVHLIECSHPNLWCVYETMYILLALYATLLKIFNSYK